MNEMRLTSDTLGPQYLAVNIRRDENTYEPIVTLHGDGRVEVATWATVDDAAREFWDAVLRLNPLLAAADACEANAKSERASLPDRVEAAARRYHFATAPIPAPEWEDVDLTRQLVCRTIARDILAAADACEAERNPNPTDDVLAELENEREAAWAETDQWGFDSEKAAWTDGYETAVAVYARRPVSSEDVHREAAE